MTISKPVRHVYVGNRRTQFREELMDKVISGETVPRFPQPVAEASLGENVELHFLGITKTLEPRLQFECSQDLWLAVGSRNMQLYAVYNPEGLSRKGMVQSFGLSPALTEARRRAIDMDKMYYRIEDAIYALGQDANTSLSEMQTRLRDEELAVLVRQLNRCIDVRGYEAKLKLQAGVVEEDKGVDKCLDDCAAALERRGRLEKAIARVQKRAQLTNTKVPDEAAVRAVFEAILAGT